ncbi:hypothetical protein VTK73DRAFT_5772 [Phialemonium thermophilum]|uniref:DUF1275 domain-containing protein n=1 Tax=Phialemonium thermophilum TaxID=223376 RepID=A0ABR3V0I7_9PEZI
MAEANGYGAISTSAPYAGSAGRDEEQPLLGNGNSKPRMSRIREKLTADVDRNWADVVLVLCYLVTGLLDSASISIWGSFVSMQTGNTVYIGLGLAAPRESTRWIKSGTSLLCFCAGSFLFSRFHRAFSPKRRWVLCASFTVQLLLVVAAAVIVTFGPPAAARRWPAARSSTTRSRAWC